jgi:membrane associated rhomboid family serine protease
MSETSSNQAKFAFLLFPGLFIVLLWLIFGIEFLFDLDLTVYSIEPREATGLLGILFFPLLHGGIEHIAGNTISLFVLLVTVRYIFPQLFVRVFLLSYFVPGIITWLIARPAYHLGASGMIYALVVFVFISGVIRVNRYLLALSMLVVFWYGGLFWGIFPMEDGISWEGHLGGALTGFFMAIWFRNELPIEEVIEEEPEWEDDDFDDFDDWKGEPDTTSESAPRIKYHFKPTNDDASKNA